MRLWTEQVPDPFAFLDIDRQEEVVCLLQAVDSSRGVITTIAFLGFPVLPTCAPASVMAKIDLAAPGWGLGRGQMACEGRSEE